ncbi:unnamed protein product [Angiostrongylus costaricensis]|uniref:Kinesin-like protein n=1 Tax=Angiostrongylus costaricensis TaxID=334426 RepID=A0A158PJX7_ANGCS|nr:unnamed protein product [Angiostrongylus costaricensis]
MIEAEFIRVTARVRPPSTSEDRIVSVRDERSLCFNPWNPKIFVFDSVFGEDVTQAEVFEDIGTRIVDGCVDGYNGTIIAYGQTGSGKTHTMFGPANVENCLLDSQNRGLMPRACDALFKKLCARAAESVQLLGVSEHRVQSSTDMMRVLEIGWEARHTAETAMSRESSRSHCIFSVDVNTEELVNNIVNKRCATLNLVDLAGSERQTQSKAFGDRFREAININSSLVVLGRVIRTLSDVNRRGEHIPYRDSKLTHILRDSLGGNSRTAVIVNVHPDIGYYSDTISALQFAADCRKIENRVCANEDLAADTVMAYKCEIARLREELRLVEKTHSVVRDILSQLWKRIESVNTLEELTKVQLKNDLSSARSELDRLQLRYESAEATRKALNEKCNNFLEQCNETFLETPHRRLNLNMTHVHGKNAKTPARRREERRQSFYIPVFGNHDGTSRVFRPVLFGENEESGAQIQGVVLEKEAALKDICDKQKSRSKQWLEEKTLFVQKFGLLCARIGGLQVEQQARLEEVKKLQEQIELLSDSISSCNDEKCLLEQSAKSLHSDKLDLEDKFQGMQNESERLLAELRGKPELETDITELRLKLSAAQQDNYSLRIRNEAVEKERHSDLREHVGLEEYCAIMNTKFDKEIEWLKKMHAEELYCKEKTIELEQNYHEKTRKVRYENHILEERNNELEPGTKRYRGAEGRTEPGPSKSGVATRSTAHIGTK